MKIFVKSIMLATQKMRFPGSQSIVIRAYCLGLLLIVAGLILVTPWKGRRVTVEESVPGERFVYSEGFVLERNFAPLWQPPGPGGTWGPEERWPGDPVVVDMVPRTPDQSITRISPDYIEMTFYFLTGLWLLSGLAGGWQKVSQPKTRSFLGAVWSLFIGLCVSGAVMMFVVFASMAYAPESMLVGIFAAGAAIGALHFWIQWARSK